MSKIQNQRPVVYGVNECPPSLIMAYMIAKTFANVEFEFDDLESNIKPGTDYIFGHYFPDEHDLKDMAEKDSNAMIIIAENDERYSDYRTKFKNHTNVYWITHKNHHVQGLYNSLKDFGGELLPITIKKLKRVRHSDDNFVRVSEMLLVGLAENADDVETNLQEIFKQLDELFSLEPHEFDTIAKYLDIHETELMNNIVDHAILCIDGKSNSYGAMICETKTVGILKKMTKKYLSAEKKIDGCSQPASDLKDLDGCSQPASDLKDLDLVMIVHTHFDTNKHCVFGNYRKGLNLELLRKIPEIVIDESKLEFSFMTKELYKYFGNGCTCHH
jgi:hypothetical protein